MFAQIELIKEIRVQTNRSCILSCINSELKGIIIYSNESVITKPYY